MMSSSRTLLARMAPPEKMGQFFGLFAFSGKVTAFLAPLAVAATTTITGSQRLGVGIIFAFLVVGLLLMLLVRPQRQLFGR
jgi:UMF1 family MFS transporter